MIFFRFLVVMVTFPFVFALNVFVLLWTLLRVSTDLIIDGDSEYLEKDEEVKKEEGKE